MKPGRQQKRKQWCQDLCLKVHYAQCFVLTHVLCVNYIIQTFPLVSKRTTFLFCARLKPKKKKSNKVHVLKQRPLSSSTAIHLEVGIEFGLKTKKKKEKKKKLNLSPLSFFRKPPQIRNK